MSRVVDQLIRALRSAAVFNPDVQAAPHCILWPDCNRQWEAAIPSLEGEVPELLILGDYLPQNRVGPAIWLRCVIAGKLEEASSLFPDKRQDAASTVPILYLPGISRQDLRAVESCPDHLKPLAELQYRGVIWSQINAKDWTILAFLKSDQGGLGLDVAQDNDTKNAMHIALHRLLEEDVELLKGKRLDKDYFNTLLTGGDPVRDLLQWLDLGDAFRASRGENEWTAFVEVCKSQLAFNPETDGALAGASKLAAHEGPWLPIWQRFCEAPKRYPNIPQQIRKTSVPQHMYVDKSGWPQWNESQEKDLRRMLRTLEQMPTHEARKRISNLEAKHKERRKMVWAELGEAPLALALEHLIVLAETTANSIAAGDFSDIVAVYKTIGWKADDATTRALACVNTQNDLQAVQTAIRAVYLPWAEDSARHLQTLVEQNGYPKASARSHKPSSFDKGECILFIDGLRFDTAKRLAEILMAKGFQIEENIAWAALPSVTATGKPAVTPVRHLVEGQEANSDFEPCVKETGQSLKGGYHLQKLLEQSGWKAISGTERGDGGEKAWTECGDIDKEGHSRGWKLAKHLGPILSEISDRVEQLIDSGWKTIRIVTDHGWLLLPGGLPKLHLPAVLTNNKWGRCAVIKPGAMTDERLYPWYWNPDQQFALADGISCYRANLEYAHGGLSLQECLNLELRISRGHVRQSQVDITDVTWRGLRCSVAVVGDSAGLSLDLRTQAGSAASSVVKSVKPFQGRESASVVVVNEELEGENAAIVLIDEKGELVAQQDTVIGGGNS